MSSKFLDKTGLGTLWAKIKSTFQTLSNLVTAWGSTPSDTKYPSEKLVKDSLDGKADDSAVLHKAGLETATGQKWFEGGFCVFNASNVGYGHYTLPGANAGTAYNNWPEEYKDGAHFREWRLSFNTGVNFWGKLRITISTSFSSFNASGSMQKTINCAFNTMTVYNNTGYYNDLGINSEKEFRISDLIWNNTTACWEIKIHSIKPKSNNSVPVLLIEFWTHNTTSRDSALGIHWVSASPDIVTDTTYYTKRTGDASTTPETGGVQFNWADTPVQQSPYGDEIFNRSHTIPIGNGGTGATTAIGAEYNILNQVADIDTTINGDRKIALCNQTKSASNGVFRWLKLSNVWTWIKGLLSSESGVNISGNAATATTADGYTSGGAIDTALQGKVDKETGKGLSTNDFTDTYKSNVDSNTSARHTHSNKSVLDGISSTDVENWDGKQDDLGISSSGDTTKFLNEQGDWATPAGTAQVQSDWNQTNSSADDYIKNKPDISKYFSKFSGSTAVYGFVIGVTNTPSNGVSSIIQGVFSIAGGITSNYSPEQPKDGAPVVGFFSIWARKENDNISYFARAYSPVSYISYTGLQTNIKVIDLGDGAYKWVLGFGTGTTPASKSYCYASCNILFSRNAEFSNFGDMVTSQPTYADFYSIYKAPYIGQNTKDVGSTSTPVFVEGGLIKAMTDALPASLGGTGKKSVTSGNYLVGNGTNALTEMTPNEAANDMLSALPNWTETPTDSVKLIRRDTSGGATFGQVTFLTVWNYILSKFPSLGWTGSSAKTLSADVYNYLIGASITFSIDVSTMRKSTPYRVYVNWHGNILSIKNTSGSSISMGVGTVGTVSVANNTTYTLPDLAPTTWTFIYDGSTLYAVPSSSVKYSLTESSGILAARATGDGSGNTISSTYSKKAVENVSNGSYGTNVGYIAPTALCVIGDSHTASSYTVENIIAQTLSASYRNNNGRVYVILNTKSSSVVLTGFASGTWNLVSGRHTTVVRWNDAYYRQD